MADERRGYFPRRRFGLSIKFRQSPVELLRVDRGLEGTKHEFQY